MAVSPDEVRSLFRGLESGNGAAFFAQVADDVDWIVEGTHPLAGHYKSKADFTAATFAKLGKVLPGGAQLHVDDLFIASDVAIVELGIVISESSLVRSRVERKPTCTMESGVTSQTRSSTIGRSTGASFHQPGMIFSVGWR